MLKRTLAILLACSVLFGACSSSTPAGSSSAAPASSTASTASETAQSEVKDTLVVAQGVDAISMDPALHTTFPTGTVLFQIYDPLVTRGADGEIVPWLAESWELLDENTWQFKLREGIKFSNGEDFDAESVKFSLERVLDPETQAPNRTRVAAIDHVDVVDKYTANIVTTAPSPTLLEGLTEDGFCALMVPPVHTASSPDALNQQPVGTGPYELVEWVKDDHITLKAKEGYWAGDAKIPNLIFRPIPETSTSISELKSGGVDIITNVPPEQIEDLNTDTTKVIAKATDRLFFLGLNTLNEGPLQNKLVRQAMMYAIDVDAINESLLGGMAQRTAVVLPHEAFGYDDSLVPYEYNPDKARELLAEAGYADGFTVQFLSRNGRYLKDKEIVETCAAYLGQVGINCEIELVEGGVWSMMSENHGREGIFYPGWSGRDADLVYYPLLYSGELQSYVDDPKLNEMIMAGRTTMDEDERLEIYKEIDAYLYEEMYQIPLFQSPGIYAINSSLNWEPRSDDIMDFRNASFS